MLCPETGYARDHSSEEPAYVLTSDQTHNDYQQYASVFDECGTGATPKASASANPRVRPAGTAARLRFIRQYNTRNVPMSAPIHSAMNTASCDKKYGTRFSAAAPYARMYPSRANDQRKPSAAAHCRSARWQITTTRARTKASIPRHSVTHGRRVQTPGHQRLREH